VKVLQIFIFSFFFIKSVYSEDNNPGAAVDPFKGKTYVKNPMEMRDPFKRKINKKKASQAQNRTYETGIYNNQIDKIEEKPIENIRIIGVMIGKERRAMAKIAQGKVLGSEVFLIKEGMILGPNGAEVKAILPGGIVLIEKIKNVYDQDEYLETVIPVSVE
jgi:type IV pilus assembly protein PilP